MHYLSISVQSSEGSPEPGQGVLHGAEALGTPTLITMETPGWSLCILKAVPGVQTTTHLHPLGPCLGLSSGQDTSPALFSTLNPLPLTLFLMWENPLPPH